MDENFSEDLKNLIKKRRSVRVFNGKKIPQKDIFSIIEAGIWAPTGCNNQELRFLILDEEKEIQELLPFKPFFRGVSHFILIFCDMSLPTSEKMYIKLKYEKHLPYVDTGLALMNMILYAKSKGIDSCIFNLSEYHFVWANGKKKNLIYRLINKFKREFGLHKSMKGNFEYYLRNQLKIPEHLKVMCGVAFGYAKIYPDIHKEIHGGRKVMRENLERYIIKKP